MKLRSSESKVQILLHRWIISSCGTGISSSRAIVDFAINAEAVVSTVDTEVSGAMLRTITKPLPSKASLSLPLISFHFTFFICSGLLARREDHLVTDLIGN